jgi:hypothetical protein
MRVLIILVAVVALLALLGWITFSNDPGRSSINLETQEIREDTGEALHKGSELLKEAEGEVDPVDEPPPPANTAPTS